MLSKKRLKAVKSYTYHVITDTCKLPMRNVLLHGCIIYRHARTGLPRLAAALRGSISHWSSDSIVSRSQRPTALHCTVAH